MPICWAWEDEAAGEVRSRCYSLEDGIGEDEATGSAAIMLAVALDRPLTIHQGRGSLLQAKPLGEGRAEVGGRVAPRRGPRARPLSDDCCFVPPRGHNSIIDQSSWALRAPGSVTGSWQVKFSQT